MTELDYEDHYEPAVPVDTHGLTVDGKPALIVLVDEYNQLVARVNQAEGRLAAAELLVTAARSRGETELDTDEIAEALGLDEDDETEPDVDGAGRTYAEYHPQSRVADEAQQPETQAPEPPPVCEGFQWIGQSFATCDRCGQPAWDHEGEEVAVDEAGPFDTRRTVRPWKPGQADAMRAKWAPPAAVSQPGKEA